MTAASPRPPPRSRKRESGSAVPLIANWPGVTPAGKVLRDLVDFSDFFATFAEVGGAKLPEGVKLDSHSFAPQLRGEGVEEVQFAEVNAPELETTSSILVARRNEALVVALVGLEMSVETRLVRGGLVASTYPEFGMEGRKAALIAVPTARFVDTVRQLEESCGLPCPKIGGKWAKASDDARIF